MAGVVGIEPTQHGFGGQWHNRLHHTLKNFIVAYPVNNLRVRLGDTKEDKVPGRHTFTFVNPLPIPNAN